MNKENCDICGVYPWFRLDVNSTQYCDSCWDLIYTQPEIQIQEKQSVQGGDIHKFDGDKLRWDLVPVESFESVCKVMTYGANKYSPNGWKTVPNGVDRYFAALMRHIVAWRKGEERDEETGLKHLEHAACNVIFLLELTKEKNNV